MNLPLGGVRIVDLTHIWAGPHCTELLGDLGAEIIKVEPPHGDMRRGFRAEGIKIGPFPKGDPGERPWNRNVIFNVINRNKLAISLNLRTEKGKEILRRLVKISDVVLENYRPGALKKMGIEYESLKKVKPDIIMVDMSGYGEIGPWYHYRAYGIAMEPMCGFFSLTGYHDGETPIRSGVDHMDPQCATHTAGAIITALLHRHKTGRGQRVEISYLDSGANFIGDALLEYTFNNRTRGFMGNRHPYRAPQGCYRCKGEDEWVAISVGSDGEWKSFCDVLGNPPWTREERFADALDRKKHEDELDRLIEAWTLQHDKSDVMHLMQDRGVPAGAVLNMAEVFQNEQLRTRGCYEAVAHPDTPTYEYFGPRWKFSKTPLRIYRRAPLFAEHTGYVLGELLGLSAGEIKQLLAEKIIFEKPEVVSKDVEEA